MASLDHSFRTLLHTHLERSATSGRRFGVEALGDPGFVASLAKGRRLGLKTADRVLAFIGAAPLTPAFRREVEAFIGTEKGFTYRLTLAVAARGSAQILIRNAAASNPVWAGKAPGEARIGALVRLIGAVARREPLPGYAIEAPGNDGDAIAGTHVPAGAVLRTVEIWRGPRFEARVVEILDLTLDGDPGGEAIAEAAGIAARRGPGVAPGIAAAWLAGPGTGPSGGRIAVTVHERAGVPRTGASR